MAECEKMMQLCEASIDQALSREEQETLDRHLAECPACAAYLADLRFLASSMGEVPEPPEGLHEKVMSGIREEMHRTAIIQTHRPSRRMPVFTMLAAAAACVALVLSGAMDGLMNVHLGASGGGLNSTADTSGAASPTEDSPQDAPAGSAESGFVSSADAGGTADTGAGGTADAGANESFSARSAETPAAEPFSTRSTELQETLPGPEENAGRSAAVPEAFSDDSEKRSAEGAYDTAGQKALPQLGAFLSNVMNDEIFAACYLVEGGTGLPDLGQEQQRDANFAYYVADNNLAQLETLLDALEKAGCTVNLYEEDGVLFNTTAKRVIFAVRLE